MSLLYYDISPASGGSMIDAKVLMFLFTNCKYTSNCTCYSLISANWYTAMCKFLLPLQGYASSHNNDFFSVVATYWN